MKLTQEAVNLMPDEYSDRLITLYEELEEQEKLYYFPSRALKIAKEVREEISFLEEMEYCSSGQAATMYGEFEKYLESFLQKWQEWAEEE